MNDERWQGIGWCDVTRNGARIGIDSNKNIYIHKDQLATVAPEQLLYLRADTDDYGVLAVAGQGHSKGDCWLFIANQWKNIGFCGGQNCVEVVSYTTTFEVFRQIAADRYVKHLFSNQGVELAQVIFSMPWTSQGFLDASLAGLLLTDNARRIGDVFLPHSCGPYLVGQDVNDPPKLVLADKLGKRLKVLAYGDCNEPRAAFIDDRIVACSRSGNNGALLALGRYDEFPDYISNPIPMPIPNPIPGDNKMLDTLNSLRSHYGSTMNDDECVELCNDAAYIHRAEGYGVSRKEQGTRGRRYDGQECCHDVIMLKDGTYWDVLASAGGVSTPTWGSASGRITDPNRGWIAPIPPKSNPIPNPVPNPTPIPNNLEARVTALETKVANIENFLRSTFRGF